MMRAEAVSGGVWHIELQRPEKRNALGMEAYTLLADVLRQIGRLPDGFPVLHRSAARVAFGWACGRAGVQTGPSEPRGRHGRRLFSDSLLQRNSG